MFSSQYPLMFKMWRDASPESRAKYSYVPALGQMFTTAMWTAYAVSCLPTTPIIAINSLGVAISLTYLLFFLVCRPTLRGKLEVLSAFSLVIGVTVLYYGLLFGTGYEKAQMAASIGTIIVNVSLWSSPLQALRIAARELDTKRISIPLTVTQAFAASTWTAAGFLLGDMTLIVTSIVGVALTPVQVGILVYIYWKRRRLSPEQLSALGAGSSAGAIESSGSKTELVPFEAHDGAAATAPESDAAGAAASKLEGAAAHSETASTASSVVNEAA